MNILKVLIVVAITFLVLLIFSLLCERMVKLMEIFFTSKIKIPNQEAFRQFIQRMAYRVIEGHCRYGAPSKEKLYLTRLMKEIKAYKKTGNAEHLLNVANYCHLEMCAPEHPKHHYDNTVDSVTRNGGKK